jgi:hypothetical protein
MYRTISLLQGKLTNIMRGKLVCNPSNISTWTSINPQLDAWLYSTRDDRSVYVPRTVPRCICISVQDPEDDAGATKLNIYDRT